MTTRKVLITGVNGFIGSHLATQLANNGYCVIGVSRSNTSTIKDLAFYEQADIRDLDRMEDIFNKRRPDFVIHLAAVVHKESMLAEYQTFYRTNYLASENIFRLCQKYSVKKILFSSTVEVYGVTNKNIIDENEATKPKSDYAKTKLLAEKSLETLARAGSINYAIMRFSPVYSKEFTLNLDRRIYMIKDKIAYYFGNGKYFFNMCSISNISNFTLTFLNSDIESGIYNISNSKNLTVKEIILNEKKEKHILSIRLPYKLSYFLIKFLESLLKMLNKKSILNIYNFEKLFKCTVYDNSKAQKVSRLD